MKIVIAGAGLGGLTFGACAARDGERLAALPAGRTLRFDGAAELAAGAAGAVLMQLRFRLL